MTVFMRIRSPYEPIGSNLTLAVERCKNTTTCVMQKPGPFECKLCKRPGIGANPLFTDADEVCISVHEAPGHLASLSVRVYVSQNKAAMGIPPRR